MVSVNCYLIKTNGSFILIDTGFTNTRPGIEKELEKTGVNSDNLKLIILTHGDFDHCGNLQYLSKKFNAKTAMHKDDLGMVENGDIFWGRKKPNFFMNLLAKMLFKLDEADRLKPSVFLEDNQSLKEYGLDASVIHIPGHTKGSIGVITSDGDLFCGDFFENRKKPVLNSLMDNAADAKLSLKKINEKHIKDVYPGHGGPFRMKEVL